MGSLGEVLASGLRVAASGAARAFLARRRLPLFFLSARCLRWLRGSFALAPGPSQRSCRQADLLVGLRAGRRPPFNRRPSGARGASGSATHCCITSSSCHRFSASALVVGPAVWADLRHVLPPHLAQLQFWSAVWMHKSSYVFGGLLPSSLCLAQLAYSLVPAVPVGWVR